MNLIELIELEHDELQYFRLSNLRCCSTHVDILNCRSDVREGKGACSVISVEQPSEGLELHRTLPGLLVLKCPTFHCAWPGVVNLRPACPFTMVCVRIFVAKVWVSARK